MPSSRVFLCVAKEIDIDSRDGGCLFNVFVLIMSHSEVYLR